MIAIFDGSQSFGSRWVPLEDLVELVEDQRRVLVRHGEVHGGLDHVPRSDRVTPRSAGQDLLDDRHSHRLISLSNEGPADLPRRRPAA